MVKVNRLIIIAALSIVLLAMAGAASASVTFKVDQIQRNGYYTGVPTLLSGGSEQFGYTYTFVPDGSYTVFGTVTNDANADVHVGVGIQPLGDLDEYSWLSFYVPANGKSSWTYKLTAPNTQFQSIVGVWLVSGWPLDFTGVDVVDGADTTIHTVDEGPMSNATAIFSNGHMTYDGAPIFMVS